MTLISHCVPCERRRIAGTVTDNLKMNKILNHSIELLKSIAFDSEIKSYEKRNAFKSQVEILKGKTEEFYEWLKRLIDENENFIESREHQFDFELRESIDYLNESKFIELINYCESKISKGKSNITAEIMLIEAQHLGKYNKDISNFTARNYSRRKYNAKITDVYEIQFPCSYHQLKQKDDRLRYCDCGDYKKSGNNNFGGLIDGLEEDGINKILTINPIPKSLKVNSVNQLTIGFNFDKAFWIPIEKDQEYFIQHNDDGDPIKEINTIDKSTIEFYKQNPLVECEVLIEKTPIKYIHHMNSKNEWRLGGMPNWWQEETEIECIKCKQKMDFILQLPSGDLVDSKGEGVHYGAHGTTYGFWCDKDKIMGYIWQDT